MLLPEILECDKTEFVKLSFKTILNGILVKVYYYDFDNNMIHKEIVMRTNEELETLCAEISKVMVYPDEEKIKKKPNNNDNLEEV